MSFLDDVKAGLIADGLSPHLFDYFEERIEEIVSDKLSQCQGDIEEHLREEIMEKTERRLGSLEERVRELTENLERYLP